MRFDEKRIESVCDRLIKNKPDHSCVFYKMWLTKEILYEFMGNEWTDQAIFPNDQPITSKTVQDAIRFLRTKGIGFQFQERVSRLAIRLYDIQEVLGLEKVIKEITSGDIYGGYAEIEAGSFLKRREIAFKFILPSGEKGDDFDIKILAGTVPINFEVKHKIEDTLPSKKSLERVLSKANKQVPNNEPALFFIKIPEEWVKNENFKSIIERTKGTFFSRNKNVLGFILHWEERDEYDEGEFQWKSNYEENLSCMFGLKEINEKLKCVVDFEDTLIYFVRKYIKKCRFYPYEE